MGLAWLQRTGGTPVALVGGGTGMGGDPNGKRNERPMLSLDQVVANARGIRAQFEKFLDFGGATPPASSTTPTGSGGSNRQESSCTPGCTSSGCRSRRCLGMPATPRRAALAVTGSGKRCGAARSLGRFGWCRMAVLVAQHMALSGQR